ncbi:MAG: hypothetical protein M0T80_08815 [Actinomycetota bacterium]|nr:hypothetical protein [Actinomycetota bacterium]
MLVRQHLISHGLVAVMAGAGLVGAGVGIGGTRTEASTPVTYSGCISRFGGLLYGVTSSGTAHCYARGARSITWNERGPAGPQGPAGATGPAGPQGPAGTTGAAGPQGPAGTTGPAGPQGPAGKTGPAGATGPAGPAGATGPAGPQGPAGPAGPEGPPGVSGAASATFATPGTYSYVVPAGVTNVFVEVQAGGGGGGGYSEAVTFSGQDQASAGGGQGGYVEALVPVTPGQTLVVTVGAGGEGGFSVQGGSGSRGSNSSVGFTDDTQLVQADGGGGGGTIVYGNDVGGAAGFGALAAPAIGVSEQTAAAGDSPPSPTTGGPGGGPAGFAGSGGAGANFDPGELFGTAGSAGYVVILP